MNKKLVKVGQGLSFIDHDNKIIYDAGGTITWEKYKIESKLIKGMKYTIIISHWHLDHYRYLEWLVEFDYIAEIYCNYLVPDGERFHFWWSNLKAKCISKNIKLNYITADSVTTVNQAYKISSIKTFKTINQSSIIMYSEDNEWVLVGDQICQNITISPLGSAIGNLQVPHHGGKAGDYTTLDKW